MIDFAMVSRLTGGETERASVLATQFFVAIADGQRELAYEGMTLQSFKTAVSFEEFRVFMERLNLGCMATPHFHYDHQVTASCVVVKGDIWNM